jgi:hypothetical protein
MNATWSVTARRQIAVATPPMGLSTDVVVTE